MRIKGELGAIRAFLILTAAAFPGFSQGSNPPPGAGPKIIVGAGYMYPEYVNVSPGQVITLFVPWVPGNSTEPVIAGPGELPTSLGGFSVTLAVEPNLSARILAVRPPEFICNQCSPPMLPITALTIQIPNELSGSNGALGPIFPLFVSENGVGGPLKYFLARPNQIRILTICDTVTGGHGLSTCPAWEVRHANGALVSRNDPAVPGETLVVYAVGMGLTLAQPPTGQAATGPARTVTPFKLDFRFKANDPPSPPPADLGPLPSPLYAGLTPGYPGLYQINFVVPPMPAGSPACALAEGPERELAGSNLTVNIASSHSHDGVPICVSVRP